MPARPQTWDTIPEMVLCTADRFGDAEAIVDGDLRLTFNELTDKIRTAAGAYIAAGIKPGDCVAIWAPNSAEWIIAAFGLLAAGGVLVPVNTRFKAAEAGDIIRRSQAKLLLVRKNFLGLDFDFKDGKADIPIIDLTSDFLASGTPTERRVQGDDVADVIYTSGTTGRPKGVMMAHAPTLRLYQEWNELAGTRQGDRYLIANPFFHIFGTRPAASPR
jgi:long-subunit acyl-CoA synthetase (AMP-forming)